MKIHFNCILNEWNLIIFVSSESRTRLCSLSRQNSMALPTSLRFWKQTVLSSAYSTMSFSWWWKNSKIPERKKNNKKTHSITSPFSLTPTIHHSSRHKIFNNNYMHSWCDSTANFLKCIDLWNEGTDSFLTPLCCIYMHKWKTIWAKQLQIVFGLLLHRDLLSIIYWMIHFSNNEASSHGIQKLEWCFEIAHC